MAATSFHVDRSYGEAREDKPGLDLSGAARPQALEILACELALTSQSHHIADGLRRVAPVGVAAQHPVKCHHADHRSQALSRAGFHDRVAVTPMAHRVLLWYLVVAMGSVTYQAEVHDLLADLVQ